MDTNVIHTGDCFEVLQDLPDGSIHACVTDPPYGLVFMGRDWDDFEPKEYQEWCEGWAAEVKRVLKPGAHLLAFSGNRTHHRLFTGVEDAGFEIRDTITWHYGSGFPKAADVSKTIDKRAGAEREVVGEKASPDGVPVKDRVSHSGEEYDEASADYDDCKRDVYERAPSTDQAKRWDGWKTSLKPATEYVVVARKPFDGATVDCVLEHGTGAMNTDECRVGDELREFRTTSQRGGHVNGDNSRKQQQQQRGRYPSNVVFGEAAAANLDDGVGETPPGEWPAKREGLGGESTYGDASGQEGLKARSEQSGGGPSRYFYTSKASRSERTLDGEIENTHPTVKPLDLMEWLITLVTRENQIVLDPFTGSGTTCKAAKDKARRFVGIEKQEKWADVARVRAGITPDDPATVRDEGQAGYEQFT